MFNRINVACGDFNHVTHGLVRVDHDDGGHEFGNRCNGPCRIFIARKQDGITTEVLHEHNI